MVDLSDIDSAIVQLLACNNQDDFLHLIETTPVAMDLHFHRALVRLNGEATTDDSIPSEMRSSFESRFKTFFLILGDIILGQAVRENAQRAHIEEKLTLDEVQPDRETRLKRVLDAVTEELRLANSKLDLIRTYTRLYLNILSAYSGNNLAGSEKQEGSERIEQSFLHSWLPVVGDYIDSGVATNTLDTFWNTALDFFVHHGLHSIQIVLEERRETLFEMRWADLPEKGPSKAILCQVQCSQCGGLSWVNHWIVVYRDYARLSEILEGKLNRYTCALCGHETSQLVSFLPLFHRLESRFLYRMVCYHDPEYGDACKVPDDIISRDQQFDKVIEVLCSLLLNSAKVDFPEPVSSRSMYSIHIAYSWDEFAGIVGQMEQARQQNDVNFARRNSYHTFLSPLARAVRDGEMSFEEAEHSINYHMQRIPSIVPMGVVALTEFDSASDDDSLMFAFLAIMNRINGFIEAAAHCWMNSAREAVSSGRWGEALQYLDRMEQVIGENENEDKDTLFYLETFISGAERIRAHLYFALGINDKGLGHLRRCIERSRERVDSTSNSVIKWTAMNDLATELMTFGVNAEEIFAGYIALCEALKICDELEATLHILPSSLSEQHRRFLLHTKGGVLNNLGNIFVRLQHSGYIAATIATCITDEVRFIVATEVSEGIGYNNTAISEILKKVTALIALLDSSEASKWGVHFDWVELEELSSFSLYLYKQAYEISHKEEDHGFAARHAINIGRSYYRRDDLTQAIHYTYLGAQHAHKSQNPETLVEALTTYGSLLVLGSRHEEAKAQLRLAFVEWSRLRAYMVLDSLRTQSGRMLDTLESAMSRCLSQDKPDEWISILETMKSGALIDSLSSQPLTLLDLLPNNQHVKELLSLEKTITEIARGQVLEGIIFPSVERSWTTINTPIATDKTPEKIDTGLHVLQEQYLEKLQMALLKSPRFSRWYADYDFEFPNPAQLLDRLRSMAPSIGAIGLWIEEEEIMVYGAVTNKIPEPFFAFRVPLLTRLKEEGGAVQGSIGRFVHDYRAKLFRLGDNPEELHEFLRFFAGPLYRAIWVPIEMHLGKTTELIVSGHGALHSIPWGTLWDGSHYIVERFAIRQVYTLNSILHMNLLGQNLVKPSILALGDPWLGDIRLGLPGAREEVTSIAATVSEIGGECKYLLGDEASEENLIKYCAGKDIIHFACHAQFSATDPWGSSLLLSASSTTHDVDGGINLVSMQDVLIKLNLETAALVVLSACETGLARVEPGDEVMGLVRSFYIAGAKRVLASLWRIDDTSSARLMECFYRHLLKEGLSFSNALRMAQLDMLQNSANPDISSPYAWGGFVLHGF